MDAVAQTLRRNWRYWLLLSALAAPILLLIASEFGFFPWSGINCTTEEVDIYSGRIRHSRFLLFIPIERRAEDSALTKALLPEDTASVTTEWHRALTFSPGLRNSPHHIFHSAIHQIHELESAWRLAEFTPSARRTSAKRVLQLWQQSGSDNGPRDYLRAVMELTLSDSGTGKRIEEGDLPKL
jgi:hypothetical protein